MGNRLLRRREHPAQYREQVIKDIPRKTAAASGGTTRVEYKIGTINAKDGLENTANKTRLFNPAYIPLADAVGVQVKSGYQLTWLAYGADKTYLGNGNNNKGLWQPDGAAVKSADILALYPDAVYFRYALRNLAGTALELTEVEKSGIMLVAADTPADPGSDPVVPPVPTGDAAVYYIAAALVAMFGCAIVARKSTVK